MLQLVDFSDQRLQVGLVLLLGMAEVGVGLGQAFDLGGQELDLGLFESIG